ncbi:BC1881 family protein [Clostridium sp. AM48-13]|nr:BC1881 family protein [Clostridium sp. AM48-13]
MSGICKADTDYLLGLTDIRRKDEEVDLSKAKTYELVAELKTREGVEVIMAEPYQKREVSVEGPAVFFIVTD